MMEAERRIEGRAATGFNTAAQKKQANTRTALSSVTLRLTPQERARLEDLAAGMTLSAYIRACVFAEDSRRLKAAPRDAEAEKKASAEALTLLGQSRIASNLNQLAHHANLGLPIVGSEEKAQIAEATAHLAEIRRLLMRDLGKRV